MLYKIPQTIEVGITKPPQNDDTQEADAADHRNEENFICAIYVRREIFLYLLFHKATKFSKIQPNPEHFKFKWIHDHVFFSEASIA